MKKRLIPLVRHAGRWTWYALAVCLTILAVVFTLARIWLPELAERKSDIEDYLSRKSTHLVRIKELHTFWDGIHPGLQVIGLRVYTKDNPRPAIHLGEMRMTLALLPLLWGNIEINNLELVKPALAFERLKDGRFRVTGFDPIQVQETPEGGGFVRWLFQQRRLLIRDGEFQWYDHQAEDAALYFSQVDLSLRNDGDRHRIGFNARFPKKLCTDCSLVLDFRGNPLETSDWHGKVYLQAIGMNIGALPAIAREKLRPGFKGRLDVRLWSDWEKGRPVSVEGYVEANALVLPLTDKFPLAIRKARADLTWRGTKHDWSLGLRNLLVGLKGDPWLAGKLRIDREPDSLLLEIQHLDLVDLTGFLTDLPDKSKPMQVMRALRPGGTLKNVSLRVDGNPSSPRDFLLEADISGADVLPYKKFPGLKGLSGHVSMSKGAGDFRLNTYETTINLPRVFRQPFEVTQAGGRIYWEKKEDHWQVTGRNLTARSSDGRGQGSLMIRVPFDRSVSPFLSLEAEFFDGNGAHAARYYPVNVLKPNTIAWLEKFIVAGTITHGRVRYEGNVREFPFRDGNGAFEVSGHVSRGVLNYLPGWAPLEYIEADVLSDGKKLVVTGDRATIRGLKVGRVVAQADDLRKKTGNVFKVSGVMSGPVSEMLAVLRDSKSEGEEPQWKGYIPKSLLSEGKGVLSLDLIIPVVDPRATTVAGEYNFRGSSLILPDVHARLDDLQGSVLFDEKGVSSGKLRARYLGGQAVIALSGRDRDGEREVLVRTAGTWTSRGLAAAYGKYLNAYLDGSAEWNGSAIFKQGRMELHVRSDLDRLRVKLPPPLDRPDGMGMQLRLDTLESSTDRHVLNLDIGEHTNGKLAFDKSDGVWRFTTGRIGLGETRVGLPKRAGLHLSAQGGYLDTGPWLGILRSRNLEQGAMPDFITRLSGTFSAVDLFDRDFGRMAIDLDRKENNWIGYVQGDSVDGSARYTILDEGAEIELNLRRLVLPEATKQGDAVSVDPRTLPSVIIKSQSFYLGDSHLGTLDFQAAPNESGWKISRLNLEREEMKVEATGAWVRHAPGRQTSRFDILFVSNDLGETLRVYGNPEQMKKGRAQIRARLTWNDAPTSPNLAGMDGDIDLLIEDGRFLQVEQGAGRLFGVLDISSLSRYLSLDFSTLFGKGFVYDKIDGRVTIEKGNAYTETIAVRGPSAQIKLSGRVGLVAEDYDLEMWVNPRLRGSLTVTSWSLWGPQVAAVVIALQKIFKKKITEGTRIGYLIEGPWDDPVITRVTKEEPVNEQPETE